MQKNAFVNLKGAGSKPAGSKGVNAGKKKIKSLLSPHFPLPSPIAFGISQKRHYLHPNATFAPPLQGV